MHPYLGQSRTSIQPCHALLTPESHERVTQPGWPGAELVYLVTPAMGARLVMYILEASQDFTLPPAPTDIRRFAFQLDGSARMTDGGVTRSIAVDDFAFFPEPDTGRLEVLAGGRLVILEWDADGQPGAEPLKSHSGSVAEAPSSFLRGDEGLVVQNLLPKDPSFDAEVNVMNFAPGASLPYVETHFMEHGLLFLDGQGVYRLGERWYPVAKGDAIWMGPHELQWFGALGKTQSRYLIWKNFNRRP